MDLKWNKTSEILPEEYEVVLLYGVGEIPLGRDGLTLGFYEAEGVDDSPSWCMNDSGVYFDLSYYEYWAEISSINLPE